MRRRWLRLPHLGGMAVAALQAALGDLCFLTVWEAQLRHSVAQAPGSASVIQSLPADLLYVEAPLSVLIPIYLGWAGLSVALW